MAVQGTFFGLGANFGVTRPHMTSLSSLLPIYRPVDEAVAVCTTEQTLTQQCLRVNPKSYCVWLHRQWIMENSPRPDWTEERRLCDRLLQYDERNCELQVGTSTN